MKILTPIALCLATLLSTGCGNALKSDYQTPQVNYPEHWQESVDAVGPVPFDWRDFQDPSLTAGYSRSWPAITIWPPPRYAFTRPS